jgi:hypothetical protein
MSGTGSNKRMRIEAENVESDDDEEGYVSVGEILGKYVDGKLCCKQKELTRPILLDFVQSDLLYPQSFEFCEEATKRTNTDEDAPDEDPEIFMCIRLRPFLDGKECCKLSELTRPVLLWYGLSVLSAFEPCEVVHLEVQPLSGHAILMDVATTTSSGEVKDRIAELVGTPREKQTLLYTDGTTLNDDDAVTSCDFSCKLVLAVGGTQFVWDTGSWLFRWMADLYRPLYEQIDKKHQVMRTLSGLHHNRDLDFNHALLTVPPMTPEAGEVFTLSVRVTAPLNRVVPANAEGYDFDDCRVSCGVVRMGHDVRQHGLTQGNGCWCISTNSGGLLGSGVPNQLVCNCVPEGEIPFGAVLCMTLDIARGTLTFAVDGVPRETGFVDIPTDSPLQWAVTAPMKGTIIEIVPN